MADIPVALPVDTNNRRYVGPNRRLPRGSNDDGTFSDTNVVLFDSAGNPLLVSVAHDAPDAGNGIKLQGRAVVTAPAAVSAVNDRVDLWVDDYGRLTVALKTTTGGDQIGGLTETAPSSDTASSGLNGRLQRIAQRLTSLIALLPTALGAGGGLKVDGSGTALPVSGTVVLAAGTNVIGSIGGLGIMAATTTIPIASDSADEAVVSALANNRLMGFSFRENAGSTASFILRHGTSTAGDPLAYVTLAPNESVREWFGPNGKACSSGVYLDMISGTIIGQLDILAVG